jgi:hypothetical protein
MGSIAKTNRESMRVDIERRERPGYVLTLFYGENGMRYERGISELDLFNTRGEPSFGPEDVFRSMIVEMEAAHTQVREKLLEQSNKNNKLVADMTRMSSRNAMLIQELALTHATLADAQDELLQLKERTK